MKRCAISFAILLIASSCRKEHARSAYAQPGVRPSILLVTLDTTRADAIGPEAKGVETPAFNALAAQGRRFRQAYTTVPQTLAAHSSILTGLYPAGHGVHENGRYLSDKQPLVTEQLHSAGYRTAAFVSAFALARRFGLARGFDLYDDETPKGLSERAASETTDRALVWLGQTSSQAVFLWVHYYDPHYPYTPPEPFRTRYAKTPYLGEVASMDQQLARLVDAFRKRGEPTAIIVVGDHGEGLGEHGEAQHGNLLYQATMHVPLLLVGPGVAPGTVDAPVSTRRVFHTILDWAGLGAANSLRGSDHEIVAAEAMKPFLDYGWQPQVMAVDGRYKAILSGRVEVYDVIADPAETHDLGASANLSRGARATLHDYPMPSPDVATATPSNASEEERRKLASLGYVAATAKPVVRADAPRPADMAHLFAIEDQAASLFVRQQYAAAIPLLEKILVEDPHNMDAALRLATAHSSLGQDGAAVAAFARAQRIAPDSQDVRTYLALHYARSRDWRRAAPLLERIVAESPDRLPAVEALADIRRRQGRMDEALRLEQVVFSMRTPSAAELVALGELAMNVGNTVVALDAFQRAQSEQGAVFTHNLELGVLYLASRRFDQARDALDRVTPSDPAYPMALFKRAQVSVLLHEPDAASRIETARTHADRTTRELIARERLFR